MSSAGRNQTQHVTLSCSTFPGILGHHHQQSLNGLNRKPRTDQNEDWDKMPFGCLLWFTSDEDRGQDILDAKKYDSRLAYVTPSPGEQCSSMENRSRLSSQPYCFSSGYPQASQVSSVYLDFESIRIVKASFAQLDLTPKKGVEMISRAHKWHGSLGFISKCCTHTKE